MRRQHSIYTLMVKSGRFGGMRRFLCGVLPYERRGRHAIKMHARELWSLWNFITEFISLTVFNCNIIYSNVGEYRYSENFEIIWQGMLLISNSKFTFFSKINVEDIFVKVIYHIKFDLFWIFHTCHFVRATHKLRTCKTQLRNPKRNQNKKFPIPWKMWSAEEKLSIQQQSPSITQEVYNVGENQTLNFLPQPAPW